MAITKDRGYFAPEKISPRQSMTPEGFLLCEAVPIARTGTLAYADGETPLEVGPDGLVMMSRDADELFRPETLASFEGKPVTLDHPNDPVGPKNWKALAVGVVQNVRRGESSESDLMLADLLITDEAAIHAVRSKKLEEVSNGYEADYEQTGEGKGRQLNIVGNHTALVEKGRCGPRCKIGDAKMAVKKKRTVMDRLLMAFKAKDEEGFKAELEEARDELEAEPEEPASTSDNDELAAVKADIAAIKALIEKLVPATADEEPADKPKEVSDEEADPAPDTAKVGDTLARAEILCPGIKMPTADKANGATLDALKHKALASADGAITAPFGDTSQMKGKALDAAFIGASELAKARNNGAPATKVNDRSTANVIADINARNRAFWKQ